MTSTLTVLAAARAGGARGRVRRRGRRRRRADPAPGAAARAPRRGSRCRSWPPTSSRRSAGRRSRRATYYRRVRPDPRTFLPLMVLAFVGSALGAAGGLPDPASRRSSRSCWSRSSWSGAYVLLKPDLGERAPCCASHGHRHTAAAMLTGLGDRVLRRRARTGHRLLLRLHPGRACSATTSSRRPPRPGWPTGPPTWPRCASSCRTGDVLWGIGLAMGVANLVGGYLGARTAVAPGLAASSGCSSSSSSRPSSCGSAARCSASGDACRGARPARPPARAGPGSR